ncbi:energy transducer TonB family protein [Aquifex sp.]
MITFRSSLEHIFYFLIAILINLILFNIFYFLVFYIPLPEVEELPPLKVEIQEVVSPSPPAKKPEKKIEKPKTPQRVKAEAVKSSIPTAEKGQIPVKAEEETQESVNILEEIKSKVLKRLEEREKLAKEVGEISAVVSQRKLTIRVGSRKLTYVPPPPTFKVKEFPSAVKIKIWVDPSGKVIKAIILQRSGIAEIDNGLLKLVKKLKFEPIDTGEVQEGIITFTFTAG